MLPDLTVLLAILLGLGALAEGHADSLLAVAGTFASVCVGVGMTWLAGERGVAAIRHERPASALSALQWSALWPVLAFAACLLFFDWGTWVGETFPRQTWLLRYAVLFVPAGALFPVAWVQRARIEAAAAAARGAVIPAPRAAAALRDGLRRNGIALLPMGLVLGILEGIWVLGWLGVPGFGVAARWLDAMPLLALGLMLLVLAVLSFFLPALLRLFVATVPLPPSPVRERLEEHAAALGLRYRDLLLWRTRERVLNAMVVGFTPRTRMIFFTDALLRHLPEEEIHAVFAHEAAHAKRHHLPLFLVLFVATAILFQVVGDQLTVWGLDPIFVVAAHLAFLWFVLLGTVSRLFEREADAFGADHAAPDGGPGDPVLVPGQAALLPGGAAGMIRALERIRRLSGRGSSHRHGTIEERVAFVALYATDPEVRTAFRARKRRLLQITAAAVLLAVAALALALPGDVTRARSWIALEDGGTAYAEAVRLGQSGHPEAAADAWQRAWQAFERADAGLEDVQGPRARELGLRAAYGRADTALQGLGDVERARRNYEALLERLASSALDPAGLAFYRFQAHVDLGRMAAWRGEAGAFQHWEQARASLPAGTSAEEAWYRARLQLLRASLLARTEMALRLVLAADPSGLLARALGVEGGPLGAPTAGAALLRRLAERGEPGQEWDEIRRNAGQELERLGVPTADAPR